MVWKNKKTKLKKMPMLHKIKTIVVDKNKKEMF